MQTLNTLPTPSLLLDQTVLTRNINSMQDRMARLGVTLRPHLKTAKSAAVARLATHKQSSGVTVSTLREAEYFFEHGHRDLLYAVGIAPGKLDTVAALIKRGADLKIITDNDTAAHAIYVRLPVGAKVRILPNHACITAAAYACYQVIDGTEVVAQWDRVNGW